MTEHLPGRKPANAEGTLRVEEDGSCYVDQILATQRTKIPLPEGLRIMPDGKPGDVKVRCEELRTNLGMHTFTQEVPIDRCNGMRIKGFLTIESIEPRVHVLLNPRPANSRAFEKLSYICDEQRAKAKGLIPA